VRVKRRSIAEIHQFTVTPPKSGSPPGVSGALRLVVSQEWWAAWDAYSHGNAVAGNQFMQDAQASKHLAAQRGCTWAQRRLPSPASPVLPVGAPGHTLPPINPGPASPVQPVSATVGALPPNQG
jgi:hypothetical protein